MAEHQTEGNSSNFVEAEQQKQSEQSSTIETIPTENINNSEASSNNENLENTKKSKEEKLQKRKERWESKKNNFKKHKKQKKEVKQEQKKKDSDEFFNKMREELSPEEFEKLVEENKKKKEERIRSQRMKKEELINKLKQAKDNGITNDCNVCINVDCSFNDKMTNTEVISLAQQLGKCYAAYKRMEKPFYMTFTSLQGELYENLKKFEGFPEKWVMKTTEEHFTKEFEDKLKENKVIYLSADAEKEITEFEKGHVYVIGGIIDRNRHKNLCNELATKEYNIPTAKFPLDKHIDMKACSVLTTNQCVEIIADCVELKEKKPELTNFEIWGQALEKIIPKRKRKDHNKDEDDSTTADQ